MLGTSRVEPLLRDIRNGMFGAGMTVESAKGECNFGQHEIAFRYADVLSTADNHVVYKNGAKEIAAQHGKSLTFMAKFDEREGNSCHIHLSLRGSRRRPGVRRRQRSTAVAIGVYRRFVAGILATLREFTLLYAPNINSYKRFAAGSFAPTTVAWGRDNRTCAVRLVGHGAGSRLENRVPGGDVNPYLAIAGMLAGGMYGIEQELDLEDELVGNAYDAVEPATRAVHLRDARDLFRDSAVARAAFGDDVVEHYAHAADIEIARLRRGGHRLGAPTRLRAAVTAVGAQASRTTSGRRLAFGDGGITTLIDPASERLDRRGRPGVRPPRPTPRSRRRPGRSRPGGPCRPATGPGCCAGSPHWSTPISTSSPTLEVRNSGHTLGNARWEAGNVRDVLDYYSGAPERLTGQQIPVAGGIDVTFHEPIGVVGIIVPWNFPMPIAGWGFAPALAAGNTVVLKPAELTPLTALRLAELGREAGLPAGVFTVVPGRGSVVGARFVEHPAVRKICFTGSTEVGKQILAGAARRVKRVTLELGGKSANIVFADADLARAAASAPMAAFDNTGQDCCARSRDPRRGLGFRRVHGAAGVGGHRTAGGQPRRPGDRPRPADQRRPARFGRAHRGRRRRRLRGEGA